MELPSVEAIAGACGPKRASASNNAVSGGRIPTCWLLSCQVKRTPHSPAPTHASHVGSANINPSFRPPSILPSMAHSMSNPPHRDRAASSSMGSIQNEATWEVQRLTHHEMLTASLAEHERVRDEAIRTLKNARDHEEIIRLQTLRKHEEERVRLATLKAEEECKMRELENKARSISKLPPRIPTPPPRAPSPPPPSFTPPTAPRVQPAQQPIQAKANGLEHGDTTPNPPVNPFSRQQPVQPPQPVYTPPQAPPQVLSPPQQVKPPAPHVPTPATKPRSPLDHLSPRYVEIHKSCKQLRKFVLEYHPDLKKQAGNMRRVIQRSVGQLTDNKVGNRKIINTINAELTKALSFTQPGIDPRIFMLSRPEPNPEGAINNGETISALFLYLINIVSKNCIKQWINESVSSPKSADHIGVLAVNVFAKDVFRWRNMSFIDIMMAKFRVNCPVLFGIRGSDKTEEGRARLGWRKIEGHWLSEQDHTDRMVGLGAGFASISLRDFRRSPSTNPLPAWNYWQAMSRIVCTPPDEACTTHYVVLRAMIDGFESKIFGMWGFMGKVALKTALVDFPSQAIEHNAAVMSLEVLADKLARDDGMNLRYRS